MLTILIWFSKSVIFIKYITENGVAVGQFFSLFALTLPQLLIIVIPISQFIASLLILNQIRQNNEVVALRASGLSNFKVAKPLIFFSFFLFCTCLAISFYAMPYANKKLRVMRTNIGNYHTSLHLQPKVFEYINDFVLYAKERDAQNNLKGVFVSGKDESGESFTVAASLGKLNVTSSSVFLDMEDGFIQKFDSEKQKLDSLHFDQYLLYLNETSAKKASFRWKANERYFNELREPEEGVSDNEKIKYELEIHERINYSMMPLVLTAIALFFMLSAGFRRGGYFINILLSIVVGVTFIACSFVVFNFIQKDPEKIFLLYVNSGFFLLFCYAMLMNNRL